MGFNSGFKGLTVNVICWCLGTRQPLYFSNTETRSCNHCCREKAMSITYSECVFVALVIQHAMRVRQLSSVASSCLEMKTEISHTEHSEAGH